MAFRRQTVEFFFLVSLTVTLLTISITSAFRLDDIITRGRIKDIPLTRTRPDGRFSFLRGADFQQFDKELRQLHDAFGHDRLRRNVDDALRRHNQSMIDEFELKGDNHTVAFLHWAGKKSPVIYIYTCGKINQTQNDHTLCEDAYFWRSTDYGSTFKREDKQFKSKVINNVDFCLSNHRMVIVSNLRNKTLYISENEGETFAYSFLPFAPHVISCNPLSHKLIAGHDTDAEKVYYSNDGGKHWYFLFEKVLRHYWGPESNSELFLEVRTNKPYTSELKHVKLPCSDLSACVLKDFDKSLGNFMEHTFEVEGKYLFVQKDLPSKGLYVLYKNGSDPYQNFFKHAQFPLEYEEREYKVVDASEDELMVVVKHDKDFYNLYVSDVTGVKFSLSLENILSNRTRIWKKQTTLVDIYRVRSLPGTYLANVLFTDRFGDKVRSVVSFDKGGEWHSLKAPEYDHYGLPTNCYLPHCSLHIHIVLSRWYYYIPGVMSSESAVGIIVAQGNLGERLGQRPIGVFMSNDGGLTWTKEFNYFYDFVIGDHGGIIAAVPMGTDVKAVWYTCTEGKSWKNISLDNRVRVYGMVTEPGETTLIVNLFGQYSQKEFQWLSVKLNFTSVLNQKCEAGNYTYWSPNDERMDGQCLLGQHLIYERRKSGDCCFNGMEYEREINITSCYCEADDFECDFGYEHPELEEVCIATKFANPIPTPCPEGKTYLHSIGYRKVVGDRCVGGVEDQFKPGNKPCPISAPRDLSIDFKAKSDNVEVNKQVYFNLSQQHGSTESTSYCWEFGDGSPMLNVTGLSKAKRMPHTFNTHGHFTVNVTATNTVGSFDVSADVIVLDPVISVEIDPPHAVVIGKEVYFNITLFSIKMDDTPQYGFVYFMWSFEKEILPLLTWDHEVSHYFKKAGKYDISVTAHSFIGATEGQTVVTVYEKLTTVRLSFDAALDSKTGPSHTKEWRNWLTKRLEALLYRLLKVDPSRLEVFVMRGTPTHADVSITPATTEDSRSRPEIVDLLKQKVSKGAGEIHLPKDVTVRITHVEKLPDQGFYGDPSPTDQNGSEGIRLAIGISIAAAVVVIFLIVTLAYFLRRYHRLQSRYTHLRLYSDGAELRDRDPLLEDEIETDYDQALHPQPGGTLRYVPVPVNTEAEPDSDEELIDNFQPGTLVVMPAGHTGEESHA